MRYSQHLGIFRIKSIKVKQSTLQSAKGHRCLSKSKRFSVRSLVICHQLPICHEVHLVNCSRSASYQNSYITRPKQQKRKLADLLQTLPRFSLIHQRGGRSSRVSVTDPLLVPCLTGSLTLVDVARRTHHRSQPTKMEIKTFTIPHSEPICSHKP